MWTKNDILTADKLNQLEDNVVLFNSNYSKTTWQDNDIIQADNLNNIEQSINQINGEYTPHTWVENEEITAEKLNNINTSIITIGTVIYKDNIPSVCIYNAGSQQEWGRYLFVDKSHDLSYYITGSDYVDSNDYNTSPGTFGYEWGDFRISTSITSQSIGDGLSNTNSLISKNLRPYTPGWRVLWDMVEQFRSSHSNDWFVPSLNELKEVYNQRSYLENLSTSTNYYYWSSSESDSHNAYGIFFNSGDSRNNGKNLHYRRSRLCWAL